MITSVMGKLKNQAKRLASELARIGYGADTCRDIGDHSRNEKIMRLLRAIEAFLVSRKRAEQLKKLTAICATWILVFFSTVMVSRADIGGLREEEQ